MPRLDDVTAPDGLPLAVWSDGPADAPVIVLVHGYPDDHGVWDRLVAELAGSYRVVRHDVRGAGASGTPVDRAGYRLNRLVADIGAVIASTGDDPVHLVGHDWGSVQSWAAVGDPTVSARIASYTSISGPDLAMAGAWYRDEARDGHVGAVLNALRHSWYIGFFLIPGLAERAFKRGIVQRLLPRSAIAPATTDAVNGLNLYRANIVHNARADVPGRITVPVQILAPAGDVYVRPPQAIQGAEPWVDELRSEIVPGDHWVVRSAPGLIAERITTWVTAHPVRSASVGP